MRNLCHLLCCCLQQVDKVELNPQFIVDFFLMALRYVDLVPILLRLAVAFILAGLLARHGLKKKSLDETGATAAFFVGLISFAVSYRMGMILILFYLSSSRLTKLKEDKVSRAS